MVNSYRQKFVLHANICVVCLACAVASMFLPENQLTLSFRLLFLIPMLITYFTAPWFYLAAKNRSKAWMLLLLLNVVGLAILIALKDRSNIVGEA